MQSVCWAAPRQPLAACAAPGLFDPGVDAVGAMDDAVQDGVGERGIADHLVPAGDGELTGDDQRAGVVAVFDDLQQVALLLCQ